MATRVLVLGAGFGGMELATVLSEELGDEVEVTLIDRNDSFVFGYSKLDVMFGREPAEAVKLPYAEFVKPGVRLLREEVTEIHPEERRVVTGEGEHEGDHLVVSLGADYDFDATPGLAELESEFYSVAGAERMARMLPEFGGGRAVIGVCGAPYKCPPAPSEAALLLHDMLVERGIRDETEITLLMPLPTPVPPSPETSEALLGEFAERDIHFVPGARIASIDPGRRAIALRDGTEYPFDLFLGVPKHRAPDVVQESGMAEEGYIPVDPRTLRTRYPSVYAVGDVATVGVPKAGVFAESAARVVAAEIIAEVRGGDEPEGYGGTGSCYIEFGAGRVGRVDVDFLSGPKPTGEYHAPSEEMAVEKQGFGSERRARWFNR